MRNNENQNERVKLARFTCILITVLIFTLGYLCSSNRKKPVAFTSDEIEKISDLYEEYGDQLEVWKDKKGNMIINIGK